MTKRQGRKRKRLLDDAKDRKRYSKQKEEASHFNLWRIRSGRSNEYTIGKQRELVVSIFKNHKIYINYSYLISIILTGILSTLYWRVSYILSVHRKCFREKNLKFGEIKKESIRNCVVLRNIDLWTWSTHVWRRKCSCIKRFKFCKQYFIVIYNYKVIIF